MSARVRRADHKLNSIYPFTLLTLLTHYTRNSEQLQQLQLWSLATVIMRKCPHASVREMNQASAPPMSVGVSAESECEKAQL